MEKTPPPPLSDQSARPDGVRVTAPKCVRCGKPVEARHRPFCSQRCADIDLGAWVTGAYRVATEDAPAEAGEREGPTPGPTGS
ncbi:MAG: DNA gyrase inhibitor YacG [Rhodospirillaceae bacterium]|nr:DNA gyrase inhibitor YacG [Rhodospirillaceae bacterium]